MSPRGRYLSDAEKERISDAIRRAEQGSAGEIRVHIEKRCKGEALDRARSLFGSMCVGDTTGDTGVLLYVAAGSHKAAVWAGQGVHAAAADGFWQDVIDAVTSGYRDGSGADGIVAAVDRVGELLREHMPGEDAAGNELPDEVSTS
jgi:uncharacterized membrane protein